MNKIMKAAMSAALCTGICANVFATNEGGNYITVSTEDLMNSSANLSEDQIAVSLDAKYSDKIVLVSVEKKYSEEELNALLKKYDLTLVYDYENFNMYAFSTSRSYSDEEMNTLIENLKGESNIVSAERDSIAKTNENESAKEETSTTDTDTHMEEIQKGYENLSDGMLGATAPAIKNTADQPVKTVFAFGVLAALVALAKKYFSK